MHYEEVGASFIFLTSFTVVVPLRLSHTIKQDIVAEGKKNHHKEEIEHNLFKNQIIINVSLRTQS